MIKANHTFWGIKFFDFYSKFKLNAHFKKIQYIGKYVDSNLPVLIISNHFSWWDGFIQLQLNNKFLHRKFHVIMLEEQLKKYMILNKAGCFSVKKNSRDILESLKYCNQLLNDKNNMLLIFPQGETQSIYTDEFKFEKGLGYVLKNQTSDIQVIFNINLIDYYSDAKPTLSIYYKQTTITKTTNINEIEMLFNSYAKECKLN